MSVRNALPTLTNQDIRAGSPVLARYNEETLFGDLWKRPGLSPRDRNLVAEARDVAKAVGGTR